MKLFVTDYDGTLYTDDISIKENNKMLRKLQENDFKIVISTGRSYPSIKNQVDIHQIPYDYLSCADGSIIYDNNGNVLNLVYLDKSIIKPLLDFCKTIDFEELQFSYPECYSNILKENDDRLLGINICVSTEKYNKELKDSFKSLSNKYPEYGFLDYVHPNYAFLCVKQKGISKSYAIKYLMEHFNIIKSDIYVIGDADNDYSMIKDFNGVAMTSSYEEILKIAKKKYDSVYDYIKDILKED